ncbi:MAG TPA: DNA repair exonuclease, partial [Chthonomonadales bacterium]|nr:DNA repair exonuclease [Chthonomonadales bacterium]
MKLLCTGDLHIGRRPSHTPSYLDGRHCSCAAAWEALVEGAITEKVDAVLISGDIVDRNNRFYEAFGPLERGLKRLAQAEIETFAVAGNHDYDVLPRLVDTVGPEHFHLVGRGGKWEKVPLRRNGCTLLEVHGWSFPHEYVSYNPLQTYNLSHDGNIPTLGLLHADLDQPASRYAPVPLSDLQRRPVDLWHLGHVHRPLFYEQEGTPLIFYPGCPQAMDPGETGLHSVWLIYWDGGRPSYRAMPLAAVRYDTISVDLSGVEQENEIEPRIIQALKAHLAQVSAESGPRIECLCCRLRLTGRTRLHRQLPRLCA